MSTAPQKPIFALTVVEREAELYSKFWVSSWQQLVNISWMRIKGERSTPHIARNAFYLGALVAAIDKAPLPVAKSNRALKRHMLSMAFHYGLVVGAIDGYVSGHATSRQLQESEDCCENLRTEQNLYKAFALLAGSRTQIPRYDAFFLAHQQAFNHFSMMFPDLSDNFKDPHMDYNSMTAIMWIAERDAKRGYARLLTSQA